MKLYAFGFFIIKNSNFSEVKRTNGRDHISWLHDFDKFFEPCGDFKRPLNEYDLLEVPCIHKHLIWSLKSKQRLHLSEPVLGLLKNLSRLTQHHHYLNYVSFYWPCAELSNIVELDLQLILFQIAFCGFVRKIEENRVVGVIFLICSISMKVKFNGNISYFRVPK